MYNQPRKGRDACLDMNHGFMKSIIKNQLDRDRYDKEIKEKASQGDPEATRSRERATPRRPDRAIYIPPVNRGSVAPPRTVLFKLEYCDSRSGATRRQPFVEGTDLDEFCAEFARKAGLDDRLQRALHLRLSREMPSGQ